MRMFLSGNQSIAHGARLSRVQVVSAYPITPATPASEELHMMSKRGELDAQIVNAESEIGAMGICAGATAAGCRSFSCTCSQGLALMREMLWAASGMALPIVLAINSREIGLPQGLLSDHSDCLSERDASFIQYICENNQEIIDSLIMAYKIGENEKVLLPSFVVSEGLRMSHSFEPVDVPEQNLVDRFLPAYRPKHVFVDLDYPMVVGIGVMQHYVNFKRHQYQAMQDAKPVIREVCREFAEMFGRKYDLVEAYKTDDAEMVVVAMGSVVSILREKIDEYRAQGKKIGLLKIRVFRPFPEEEVRAALSHAGKVLVIDRACSPGATYGVSCIEVRAALQKSKSTISNMIISARDITARPTDEILNKWFKSDGEWVEWFQAVDDERTATLCGWDNYEKLVNGEQVDREVVNEGESPLGKGTVACVGCMSAGAIRQAMDAFGKNTVVVSNAGCGMAFSNLYPTTAWRVPYFFFTYSHAGAAASGIEVAMKLKGIKADLVLIAGDGALYDIGLQTFSAALERGHRIIYICYDNQAYMNTGVQSSGSTPYAAKTKTTLEGRKGRVKNIEQIVAAHGDIYIATASPAYPSDLKRKLKKARGLNKPSFIHIICPCPPGWEYDPALSIEISRLAVETGTVVLYEYENRKLTLNKLPKDRKPVEEYLMKQGRFSHLTKAQVAEIQAEVESNLERLTAGNLV